MADINNQPVLFDASGLLSAQVGPGGVGFDKLLSSLGGLTDEPSQLKKIRIQGIRVLGGGAGTAVIYDAAAADVRDTDSVWESAFPATGGSDSCTNLGINIKSGDIYVAITGAVKVYLYLDLNK